MKELFKNKNFIFRIMSTSVIFITLFVMIFVYNKKFKDTNTYLTIMNSRIFKIDNSETINNLKIGDFIVTDIDYESIEISDIITYLKDNNIYTKRVSDINKSSNGYLYTVKSDTNESNDLGYITNSNILGKYKYKIPFIGQIMQILSKYWVFIGTVFLILIAIKKINKK